MDLRVDLASFVGEAWFGTKLAGSTVNPSLVVTGVGGGPHPAPKEAAAARGRGRGHGPAMPDGWFRGKQQCQPAAAHAGSAGVQCFSFGGSGAVAWFCS